MKLNRLKKILLTSLMGTSTAFAAPYEFLVGFNQDTFSYTQHQVHYEANQDCYFWVNTIKNRDNNLLDEIKSECVNGEDTPMPAEFKQQREALLKKHHIQEAVYPVKLSALAPLLKNQLSLLMSMYHDEEMNDATPLAYVEDKKYKKLFLLGSFDKGAAYRLTLLQIDELEEETVKQVTADAMGEIEKINYISDSEISIILSNKNEKCHYKTLYANAYGSPFFLDNSNLDKDELVINTDEDIFHLKKEFIFQTNKEQCHEDGSILTAQLKQLHNAKKKLHNSQYAQRFKGYNSDDAQLIEFPFKKNNTSYELYSVVSSVIDKRLFILKVNGDKRLIYMMPNLPDQSYKAYATFDPTNHRLMTTILFGNTIYTHYYFKSDTYSNSYYNNFYFYKDTKEDLMWMVDASLIKLQFKTKERLKRHIDKVNSNELYKYNDWRLPTKNELLSIGKKKLEILHGSKRRRYAFPSIAPDIFADLDFSLLNKPEPDKNLGYKFLSSTHCSENKYYAVNFSLPRQQTYKITGKYMSTRRIKKDHDYGPQVLCLPLQETIVRLVRGYM